MSAFSCTLHEAGAGLVLFTDVFMVPSPESAPLRDDGKYLGRAKPLKTPGEIVTSVIPRVTRTLNLHTLPTSFRIPCVQLSLHLVWSENPGKDILLS